MRRGHRVEQIAQHDHGLGVVAQELGQDARALQHQRAALVRLVHDGGEATEELGLLFVVAFSRGVRFERAQSLHVFARLEHARPRFGGAIVAHHSLLERAGDAAVEFGLQLRVLLELGAPSEQGDEIAVATRSIVHVAQVVEHEPVVRHQVEGVGEVLRRSVQIGELLVGDLAHAREHRRALGFGRDVGSIGQGREQPVPLLAPHVDALHPIERLEVSGVVVQEAGAGLVRTLVVTERLLEAVGEDAQERCALGGARRSIDARPEQRHGVGVVAGRQERIEQGVTDRVLVRREVARDTQRGDRAVEITPSGGVDIGQPALDRDLCFRIGRRQGLAFEQRHQLVPGLGPLERPRERVANPRVSGVELRGRAPAAQGRRGVVQLRFGHARRPRQPVLLRARRGVGIARGVQPERAHPDEVFGLGQLGLDPCQGLGVGGCQRQDLSSARRGFVESAVGGQRRHHLLEAWQALLGRERRRDDLERSWDIRVSPDFTVECDQRLGRACIATAQQRLEADDGVFDLSRREVGFAQFPTSLVRPFGVTRRREVTHPAQGQEFGSALRLGQALQQFESAVVSRDRVEGSLAVGHAVLRRNDLGHLVQGIRGPSAVALGRARIARGLGASQQQGRRLVQHGEVTRRLGERHLERREAAVQIREAVRSELGQLAQQRDATRGIRFGARLHLVQRGGRLQVASGLVHFASPVDGGHKAGVGFEGLAIEAHGLVGTTQRLVPDLTRLEMDASEHAGVRAGLGQRQAAALEHGREASWVVRFLEQRLEPNGRVVVRRAPAQCLLVERRRASLIAEVSVDQLPRFGQRRGRRGRVRMT